MANEHGGDEAPGTGDAGGGFDLKAGSTDSHATEAYYDDWAADYDATLRRWNYQAPDDAVAILAPHLAAGARILDVGCGTGLFAQALKARVTCHVDGLDISAASLEIAERNGDYGTLQRHDLQETPLPVADDGYDAAACIGVLTYIEDSEALLADLCRVVRAGGFVHFTQRDDRWREIAFDGVLQRLTERGLWQPVTVSEPKPYLPENDDFGADIRVIHALYRVA